MILVIGAAASGKRAYIRSMGITEADIADGTLDERPVLIHLQELVRANPTDAEALLPALLSKAVVACDEVGAGVIPLDAGERAWREAVGRLCILLAEKAERVVRCVCSIPQIIKGAYSMEVVLIRHGETAGNVAGQWSGSGTDEPLTPAGVAGAKAVSTGLSPERVYVSPMRRARQTAGLLFPAAEQVVVEGLREMHFGRFEGKSHEELKDDPAYCTFIQTRMVSGSPGGETLPAFTERVCAAFAGLVEAAAGRGERRVVVVAHGGTLMALMGRYAFPEAAEGSRAWHAYNCCGWRGRVDVAAWRACPRITAIEPFPEKT